MPLNRYVVRPLRAGWTVEANRRMLCSCAHFEDALAMAECAAQRTGGELGVRDNSGEVQRRQRFQSVGRGRAK